jgi:(R)-2-hydroxyacyl-CoA dehydratese activating ATPase
LALSTGIPRNTCAWTQALYGLTLAYGLKRVLVVSPGDCSANLALGRLLEEEGVEVVQFSYPVASRNREEMGRCLTSLCQALGTTMAAAELVFSKLKPIRSLLEELDHLSWTTGQVTPAEANLWLLSSTDLAASSLQEYEGSLRSFLLKANSRPVAPKGLCLGLVGVPTPITDLHKVVADSGGAILYNETPHEFAMIPGASSLVDQYLDYSYPYGVHARLPRINAQAQARKLDGFLIYNQTFCHHNLEAKALNQGLAQLPCLNMEGDRPGPLTQRERLRVEAFIQSLNKKQAPKAKPQQVPLAMGLDLGSRFAKLAVKRASWTKPEFRRMDTIEFYKSLATRTESGLHLSLDKILRELFDQEPDAHMAAVATGYGRHIQGLSNCQPIPEIHAHARGASAQVSAQSFVVADLGGQDTKVIQVTKGMVEDFTMNDRCAAGSGRYVENMARLLGVEVAELVRFRKDPVALSNICATFGESEVVGLVVDGVPVEQICAGVMKSVAARLIQMLAKFRREQPLWLSGGLAASPALIHFIQSAWDGPVASLPDHSFNGALGALLMVDD